MIRSVRSMDSSTYTKCKLMVAGKVDASEEDVVTGKRLRVATKYINSARRFYAAKGRQVELIKLYGSMELAPVVGLADRIVDVVDTGGTLKANGLKPMVNRASMKMKHEMVTGFISDIVSAVEKSQ